MNIYYVYAYLRNKDSITAKAGTPYYIGKGVNNRAYEQHRRDGKGVHTPKDKSRIVILESNLTEVGAFALERRMIRWFGRKDNRTGTLENRTDGGEGISNPSEDTRVKMRGALSAEHRASISNALKGVPKPAFTNKHRENISNARKGKTPAAKTFKVTDPSGVTYIVIGEFIQFCRDHKLHRGKLRDVAMNRRPDYKGWTAEYLINNTNNMGNSQ